MSETEDLPEFIAVPPEKISADVLEALIEDFILREGANHGAEETPMSTKVKQVHKQLANGSAVIVYHFAEETCRIVPGHLLR
jgi:uncharacterized protein YheU (UPF0270 family)